MSALFAIVRLVLLLTIAWCLLQTGRLLRRIVVLCYKLLKRTIAKAEAVVEKSEELQRIYKRNQLRETMGIK